MKHAPIDPELFIQNRSTLAMQLPKNALAVVNANDLLPVNADALLPMHANSDLFYLTGIEQEETVLMLSPDAFDPRHREILFLREPNAHSAIWEGHKHSKEEASRISGIRTVRWLSELPGMLRQLICDADAVVLNSNEHKRAHVEVETRDARFARDCMRSYPLHRYERLAPLLHQIRARKSPLEIELMQKAVDITKAGFERVCRFVTPGVWEQEVEAEFAHEFIRQSAGFAYTPIVASGKNSCVLHYIDNNQRCKNGEVLLLDVGAKYANYAADLTRTIPVNGKFTRRQRAVYNAVLRVMRASIQGATVGKLHRDWQREAQRHMSEELLELGLIKPRDLRKHTPESPSCTKYFMHGLGHSLGLDVHDVAQLQTPFEEGWVLTVEPGLYIPEEGFGVRLENNVLLTKSGPKDLTGHIPVEADEIEELMQKGKKRR
jgi:Xaa-Pro aminopeptidase